MVKEEEGDNHHHIHREFSKCARHRLRNLVAMSGAMEMEREAFSWGVWVCISANGEITTELGQLFIGYVKNNATTTLTDASR